MCASMRMLHEMSLHSLPHIIYIIEVVQEYREREREMAYPKYDPHNMRRGALQGQHRRIMDSRGHRSPNLAANTSVTSCLDQLHRAALESAPFRWKV